MVPRESLSDYTLCMSDMVLAAAAAAVELAELAAEEQLDIAVAAA